VRPRPGPGRVRSRVVEDSAPTQLATASTGQGIAPGPATPTALAEIEPPAVTPSPTLPQRLRQHINVNRVGAAVAIATLIFTGSAT